MDVTEAPDTILMTTEMPTNCTIIPYLESSQCLYKRVEEMTAMDTYVFIMYLPAMLFFVVLGLVGNTLAYVVMSKEMRQSSSTICLKALAVADNMVLITHCLYFSMPMFWTYLGTARWATLVHELIKPYLWAAIWFSKTLSVYIIVQMTIERYLAICQPLLSHRICRESTTKFGILAVIIMDFIYNLPKVFQYQTAYECDRCTGEIMPKTVIAGLYENYWYKVIYVKALYFIIMFVFPLSILFVLNLLLISSINRATRRREGMVANAPSSNDNVTEKIVGVVIAFLVLETPAVILNILYIFKDYESQVNDIGTDTGINYHLVIVAMRSLYIISSINSCINFYIYCLVGKRFRRILIHTLTNCGTARSSPETSFVRSTTNGVHLDVNRTHLTKISNSSLNAGGSPRSGHTTPSNRL